MKETACVDDYSQTANICILIHLLLDQSKR